MLPGLHPFSLYSFNVRVYNGKGEGPASLPQQFETPEGGKRRNIVRLSFFYSALKFLNILILSIKYMWYKQKDSCSTENQIQVIVVTK